jgi:hypothetical protein
MMLGGAEVGVGLTSGKNCLRNREFLSMEDNFDAALPARLMKCRQLRKVRAQKTFEGLVDRPSRVFYTTYMG